jgi:hypothetical protein
VGIALAASIHVYMLQVIQVGRHTFEFTVRKEDRVCDLLRLPAVDGTAATEIGSVQQSLLVKVVM